MEDYVAPIHYQELAEKDPNDVCRRAKCAYNQAEQYYELEVWGDMYRIYAQKGIIERPDASAEPVHDYLTVFIIHYLLGVLEMETEDEWISEKDIPGGVTFFRGPHAIPTNLISGRFQNDLDAFGKRCEFLGGQAVEMGDAAYRFQITDRVPVVVLYWQGDEDFPPEARLLYDRSIQKHFAADVVFALAVEMCIRIGRQ